jgi:predicted DsbA family dithiol-disulfide isomerase
LQQEFDLKVKWVAFPLHPETPDEGRTLEDLFSGRGLDIPQMLARLKRTASGLGLPFGTRTMTYNSRRAQELGKWAEDQGCGQAFHNSVFQVYFAQGRNIAQMAVLKDLAAAVGLNPVEAQQVLADGRYAEAVDQDWERSHQLGVTAVPTFVCNGRGLVGAQSYEALRHLVSASVGL